MADVMMNKIYTWAIKIITVHSITLKAKYLKEFDVKKMDAVEKYSGSMYT